MSSRKEKADTEAVEEIDAVEASEAVGDTELKDATESKETERQALIYCGPSIPKGILTQYTTYRGGFPKYLKPHIEKCPAIGRLFISPGELNSTVDAVNRAGTAENVWKNEVLDYIKGGIK
jgi:hypothetical protein